MQQSRLVQRSITSLAYAEKEFGDVSNNLNDIPIVLIPTSPSIIQLSATIPPGYYVLWQQWDRDMGELSPGVIWLWPAWNRVSHIVTKAPVTYFAPVKNCPTIDNGEK